jgi:serine protease
MTATREQGHLDPAPLGIDARAAHARPGGDGAGQSVVCLDWGWNLRHEALAAHRPRLVSGVNHSRFHHGTAALGVLAARGAGPCVGVAPGVASVRCVSPWREGGGYSTAEAIADAVAVMAFGDVLLVNAQTHHRGRLRVPVEVLPPVFEAIVAATAAGVLVVEAAGNGGADLDAVTDERGARFLRRGDDGFRDSGALLVAAATPEAPHARMGASCFGSRVDCFAWGARVFTLHTDAAGRESGYAEFGGTSSAAPIVAGAALAVQGLAEAALGRRLSPAQLRATLSDPRLGTPSADPARDRVGVMPDLRAVLARGLRALVA